MSVKSVRYSETEKYSTDVTNKCTIVVLGGGLPTRRWSWFQVSKYDTEMYYTEASHFINAIVQQMVIEYITAVALHDWQIGKLHNKLFQFTIMNIKFVLPIHFELWFCCFHIL